MLPAAGLVLLLACLLPHSLCLPYHSLLAEIQGWPSDNNATDYTVKRAACVTINNYCGKPVPGIVDDRKKECCGELICHKNKCRRRTCC